jgi:VCBS repeat-containing protein
MNKKVLLFVRFSILSLTVIVLSSSFLFSSFFSFASYVEAATPPDDEYTTDENTLKSVTAPGVLANDTGSTVQSVDDTSTIGIVTWGSDGSFTYDPNNQFEYLSFGTTATDAFQYSTDVVGEDPTVTIIINGVNDPPTAVNDTPTTDEDTPLSGIAVLSNDTDPDTGDVLSVSSFDDATTIGTVTLNLDDTFDYNPNGQFESLGFGDSTTDSFSYTITDGNGGNDTATVTITINGVNDPPVVSNFAKTGPEDTDVTFAATDFINNFTDPDLDILVQVQVKSLPTNGTLKLNTTPVALNQEILAVNLDSLVFTPDPNWNGSTSFTWNASDGQTYALLDATVSITIDNLNDPPTISNITNQSTNEDTTTSPIGFTINDLETPPEFLSLLKASSNTTLTPASSIVFGGSGTNRTVTITPAADLVGSSTITVTVSDGTLTAFDTFTLTVNPVNDPPSFTKGADQTLNEDPGPIIVSNWATAILPGPADEAGQTLIFLVTNDNPSLFSTAPAINSAGTLTFTPAANANGVANVTVTLKDSGGTANGGNDTSAPQTFTITVNPANDAPVALSDPYSVKSGDPLNVDAPGVLDNDEDVDGDSITAQIVSQPSNGTVDLKPDGSFSYNPDSGFTGVDIFTYQAYDGALYSDVTDVEIDVYDGTKPRVEFIAPVESGDQFDVYDQIVCLKVDAEDDIEVDRVRFYWWDKVKSKYVELGVDEDPPFEWCFDTSVLHLEFNQIFAEAYDNSGNISSRKWIWLYKVADARRLFLPFVGR